VEQRKFCSREAEECSHNDRVHCFNRKTPRISRFNYRKMI